MSSNVKSPRAMSFVVDDDVDVDDDAKSERLLARMGATDVPANAVAAYDSSRFDADVGPGIDASESDMVDDIFDNASEAKANENSPNVFCRCNLATSIALIASMALLTYTMVNPATRDAVTKFALTSPTERHKFDNVKVDPKTGRPTVELMEGEAEAGEESERYGDWWRVESLKGSESPNKMRNQWDVSGIMMYSDVDCTEELVAGSFDVASESATHAWIKRAETGWGYLAGKQGMFINEPLIGGSRMSVHLEEVPQCLKISTCFPENRKKNKKNKKPRSALRRILLQSSEDAEAMAVEEQAAIACDDTHFPSTLSLYRYVKNAEEWVRASTFAGTGVSDDAVAVDDVSFKVRTFKFKNGELSALGQVLFGNTDKDTN